MKNKMTATLDRIEGKRAILVLDGGDSIELPYDMLPEGAGEGDVISLTLQKKDRKTIAEKQKVKGLIDKLSGKK